MKRLLGIIGGMGPLASVYFYELLTKMQKAETEQDYLDILLYSKPSTPDRTVFMTGQNNADPFDSLLESAQVLEQAGVSLIAIPCVTAHFFYNKLTGLIKTPIVNIVQETVDHIKHQGIKKAGILATDGTIHTRLFNSAMEQQGIQPIEPAPKDQALLMRLIYDYIKRGTKINNADFISITDNLRKRGAETVVLGCTELSLAARDVKLNNAFTDMLMILTNTCFKFFGVEPLCK